jgi:hypothetical protein
MRDAYWLVAGGEGRSLLLLGIRGEGQWCNPLESSGEIGIERSHCYPRAAIVYECRREYLNLWLRRIA